MTKTTTKTNRCIDVAQLSISPEPYPGRRLVAGSKYAEIFNDLPQNQRLRCPLGTAGQLASILKKHLAKKGLKSAVVRSVNDIGDGEGGVWWMPPEPASVWNGLGKSKKEEKA